LRFGNSDGRTGYDFAGEALATNCIDSRFHGFPGSVTVVDQQYPLSGEGGGYFASGRSCVAMAGSFVLEECRQVSDKEIQAEANGVGRDHAAARYADDEIDVTGYAMEVPPYAVGKLREGYEAMMKRKHAPTATDKC
jgi:hypothetical protein